eukprot:Trichotokara_eunicae@DN5964_c0_g1_i1.p1
MTDETQATRVVVREERVRLDEKFKFGSDIEEFFIVLESRCSARNVAPARYLEVLLENCDDVSHLAVGDIVRRFESVACSANRYLRVRDELLSLYGPQNPLAAYRCSLLNAPACAPWSFGGAVTHCY